MPPTPWDSAGPGEKCRGVPGRKKIAQLAWKPAGTEKNRQGTKKKTLNIQHQ
jgi:hypothetical protein